MATKTYKAVEVFLVPIYNFSSVFITILIASNLCVGTFTLKMLFLPEYIF